MIRVVKLSPSGQVAVHKYMLASAAEKVPAGMVTVIAVAVREVIAAPEKVCGPMATTGATSVRKLEPFTVRVIV